MNSNKNQYVRLLPASIEVAQLAGFCIGVDIAVKKAQMLLKSDKNPEKGQSDNLLASDTRLEDQPSVKKTYMLGALVHNEHVVGELTSKGMFTAKSAEDIEPGSTVLTRAHGITPQLEAELLAKSCNLVDATCGYVRKIHQIVKKAVQEDKKVILSGFPDHPEIEGINGYTNFTATVVSSPEEAEILAFEDANYILASQSTFSVKQFKEISRILQIKIAKLEIFDTICNATEKRQAEALDLAAKSDLMLIIGSRTSSNTGKLLEICQGVSEENYLVETTEDVYELLRQGRLAQKRIGITAGASSPESIIREVIHIMSEDAVNNELEQGDVSFTDYIEQIPQLHRGATVKGIIVRYDDENVYVDVRDKSEGRIPKHEFENNPDFDLDQAIEDRTEIDVYVRSIRNTEVGKEILLSKARVDFAKYKAAVEEAFNDKTPITVKVVNVVKDGVIATYGGIDIYIHRTQLELGTVTDLEPYRDQSFEILITQFDPEKRRLRVSGSRRSLLNRDRKEKSEELWTNIEVGDIYDGIVRSLTNFGAFVDIGGVDGLVHISELSWNRIKHPSEVVAVGDVIQVYVKDFEREKKRISLGFKRIEDDPYHNIEDRFPVGSIVHGKVVRMFNFGAFVEVAEGVDALCHISQISSNRLNRPEEVLKEGMEVDARVLDVNNDSRRISISIKDVAPIDTPIEAEGDKPKAETEDATPTSYQDTDQGATIASVLQTDDEEVEPEADATSVESDDTAEETDAAETEPEADVETVVETEDAEVEVEETEADAVKETEE